MKSFSKWTIEDVEETFFHPPRQDQHFVDEYALICFKKRSRTVRYSADRIKR